MPRERFQTWRPDLLAALSVTGLLIPEAVAYSQLAGLPARAGLIGLLCGLVAYGMIGRSRFAITSATSSAALIVAAALMTFGAQDAAGRAAYAACLVVAAGGWFVLAAVFRLGFLAQFIARPVLRGVTLGISTLIALSQLPVWLGVKASGGTWEKLAFLLRHLSSIHPASFLVGLLSLAVLLGWRSHRQPVALWVLVISILASRGLHLDQHGVQLVGPISLSGGGPDWNAVQKGHWRSVVQFGGLLALIAYAESFSSIRGFALKHGERTEPNRDLLALGTANLSSGLLGGLAVGAGYSGTAANEMAGAQSRAAGGLAAALLLFSVAFALPQFAWIPEPVLAAIVIHAVSHGLSWKPLQTYFQWNRDRLLVLVAVLAVLVFGVLDGLFLAVALSVLLTLGRFSQPKLGELGRWQGSHDFVNRQYFPAATRVPGLLIMRVDEPLFFANAEAILDQVRERLTDSTQPRVRGVILSLEESPDLDGTSVEALGLLADELQHQGIGIWVCRLHTAALEVLKSVNFASLPASHLSSFSVDDAVQTALQGINR